MGGLGQSIEQWYALVHVLSWRICAFASDISRCNAIIAEGHLLNQGQAMGRGRRKGGGGGGAAQGATCIWDP